jgi:hypothetical protein
MRQGQNEQGHRRDQEANGDQNDSRFQNDNVFEHRIKAKDFAQLVSHGGEEMTYVQRITSFFVM